MLYEGLKIVIVAHNILTSGKTNENNDNQPHKSRQVSK